MFQGVRSKGAAYFRRLDLRKWHFSFLKPAKYLKYCNKLKSKFLPKRSTLRILITPNQGDWHALSLTWWCTLAILHQFLQLIHQRTCLYFSKNFLYFVETTFISYFDLFKKRKNSLNAEKNVSYRNHFCWHALVQKSQCNHLYFTFFSAFVFVFVVSGVRESGNH